jgi:hypothetical protein
MGLQEIDGKLREVDDGEIEITLVIIKLRLVCV